MREEMRGEAAIIKSILKKHLKEIRSIIQAHHTQQLLIEKLSYSIRQSAYLLSLYSLFRCSIASASEGECLDLLSRATPTLVFFCLTSPKVRPEGAASPSPLPTVGLLPVLLTIGSREVEFPPYLRSRSALLYTSSNFLPGPVGAGPPERSTGSARSYLAAGKFWRSTSLRTGKLATSNFGNFGGRTAGTLSEVGVRINNRRKSVEAGEVLFRNHKRIFSKLLWKWAYKRHSNKSHKWILKEYFQKVNGKKWVFVRVVKSGLLYSPTLLHSLTSPPPKFHFRWPTSSASFRTGKGARAILGRSRSTPPIQFWGTFGREATFGRRKFEVGRPKVALKTVPQSLFLNQKSGFAPLLPKVRPSNQELIVVSIIAFNLKKNKSQLRLKVRCVEIRLLATSPTAGKEPLTSYRGVGGRTYGSQHRRLKIGLLTLPTFREIEMINKKKIRKKYSYYESNLLYWAYKD